MTTKAFTKMANRLRKDIYTKYIYAGATNNNYDPKLHVPSTWEPDSNKVDRELRARVEYFLRELKKLFKAKRSPPNLLRYQRNHLKELKHSEELIIIKTDKNLGPALIERGRYCRWVMKSHLQDNKIFYSYQEPEAKQFMERGIQEIKLWAAKYKQLLSPTERRFLKKSLELKDDNWHSYCYLMAKIHKTPMSSRLINSTSGSITHGFGVLIDRKLQPIGRKADSYISSSFDLQEKFKTLEDLPSTAKLFTADAVAMYTNINTKHALKRLKKIIPEYLLKAISLLFYYNIQKFGDTYSSQHDGTAMGVSPACMWATIYFGPYEEKLMRGFKKYLLFYVRFIDDVGAVWDFCDEESYAKFKQFKWFMNKYGSLRWKFTEPAKTIDFLDVTLSIKNKRIETSLFEKELNLHLYLPPSSAHPPGVLKGLVHGMIYRIIRLTSDDNKQQEFIKAFYRRLLYRGYSHETVLPLFTESIEKVRNKEKNKTNNLLVDDNITENPIILHVPYHPLLPPSQKIQKIFRETLFDNRWSDPTATPLPEFTNNGSKLGINRMIVAYHRDKNVGNLLAPRKIESTPGPPASDYDF